MSATLPRSKSGSRQPKLAATSSEKKCKKQTQVGSIGAASACCSPQLAQQRFQVAVQT